MMIVTKFLISRLFVCVIGVTVVSAYIDDSMMRKYGRKPSSFSPSQWYHESPVPPKVQLQPRTTNTRSYTNPVIVPPVVDVDEIVRAEYVAWSFRYGKTKDDRRYEIFKHNFMTQMEYNRKTGEFYLLNEFGDLTADEYEELIASPTPEQAGFSSYDMSCYGPVMEDIVSTPVEQRSVRIMEMGISNDSIDFSTVHSTFGNTNKANVPIDMGMNFSPDDVVDYFKIDAAVASVSKSNAVGNVSKKRGTKNNDTPDETMKEVATAPDYPNTGTDDKASAEAKTFSRKKFFSTLNEPTKRAFIVCLGSMIGSTTQGNTFLSKKYK